MTAIILAWNPDRWNDWNYTAVVEQVREAGQYHATWTIAGNVSVAAGADVWLLLQGRRGRGLLGHGVIVSTLSGCDAARRGGPETFCATGDHLRLAASTR